MLILLAIWLAFAAWCLWAVWPRGALEGAWLTVVRADGSAFGARVAWNTATVITLDRDVSTETEAAETLWEGCTFHDPP